jgi:2-C-methyl-D-erythritol 4-phosphate cytidylyltransferase
MKYKFNAIILSSGGRFRAETPKQFLKLAGNAMQGHALDMFKRYAREARVFCKFWRWFNSSL